MRSVLVGLFVYYALSGRLGQWPVLLRWAELHAMLGALALFAYYVEEIVDMEGCSRDGRRCTSSYENHPPGRPEEGERPLSIVDVGVHLMEPLVRSLSECTYLAMQASDLAGKRLLSGEHGVYPSIGRPNRPPRAFDASADAIDAIMHPLDGAHHIAEGRAPAVVGVAVFSRLRHHAISMAHGFFQRNRSCYAGYSG